MATATENRRNDLRQQAKGLLNFAYPESDWEMVRSLKTMAREANRVAKALSVYVKRDGKVLARVHAAMGSSPAMASAIASLVDSMRAINRD